MLGRDVPTILIGADAVRCLDTSAFAAQRILVVCGRRSFELSGAAKALSGLRRAATVLHFQDFTPHPNLRDIRHGVELGRRFEPDLVLGVGGGSALDVAKAIAVLASQSEDPADCLSHPEAITRPRSSSLVLVPTTAGSGSEVTRFASVYRDGCKESLDHPTVRADLAIVDPLLTHSLPPSVTASSGLDALAHAVESLWSLKSRPWTRHLAVSAIHLAGYHLERVLTGPSPASRVGMSKAALLAGLAIDATRTTAAHAFSYPLTTRFGVPHGIAVALNICWLVEYNAGVTARDCAHPDGPDAASRYVRRALGALGVHSAAAATSRFQHWIGLGGYSHRLSDWGVRNGDVAWIVGSALASSRSSNNPRRLAPDAAMVALRALL
jgi:alcohol dehydrogenase class IV